MNIQATNEVHLASNVYKLIWFFAWANIVLKYQFMMDYLIGV